MHGIVGLAVALVLAVLPSLLFLGLWHGLMYLRDDDLVEQAREMERQRPQYSPGSSPGSGGSVSTSRSNDDGTVVCPRCSTQNTAGVTYCWNCLAELPD